MRYIHTKQGGAKIYLFFPPKMCPDMHNVLKSFLKEAQNFSIVVNFLKFVFSKKATKIARIFTIHDTT